MVPFDRPYVTFYWSAIVNIALSCTIFIFLTLNNIVTLKSGLEVTQVTTTGDLKNQVKNRSRSLKMAPFDRPYATFYWSAIANIALSCTIFELFTLNIVTLKSGLQVIETSAIQKLGCGFLFAFNSNYGRICSRL